MKQPEKIDYDELGYGHQTLAGQLHLVKKNGKKWRIALSVDDLNADTEAVDFRKTVLEEIPDVLFNYPRLKVILVKCKKVASLADDFANLTQLEILNIHAEEFIEITEVIEALKKLRILSLNDLPNRWIPEKMKGTSAHVVVDLPIIFRLQ